MYGVYCVLKFTLAVLKNNTCGEATRGCLLLTSMTCALQMNTIATDEHNTSLCASPRLCGCMTTYKHCCIDVYIGGMLYRNVRTTAPPLITRLGVVKTTSSESIKPTHRFTARGC